MSTPRPDRDITRIRAQEAWAKLASLQRPDVGSRHILAGDGGVSVDLAGSMLMIGRVSATGRPIISLNPTRRVLGMGQALEVLPMGETAPATWRVPPVRIEDVYWVSGAVSGQTPGLFTPAHQFEHGVAADVAPHPTIPYDFYVNGYHVTADGTITLAFGGGSTPSEDGNILSAFDASFVATRTFSVTPSGNGVMVGLTAEDHEFVEFEEFIFPIVYEHWLYDYDQIELYSYEPATATIRNIRVRLTVDYRYVVNTDNGSRSDGGVIPSPYAEIILTADHFQFARWNSATGLLYLGTDVQRIIVVPWDGGATPPAADPLTLVGAQYAFAVSGTVPVDMAFDGGGAIYVATVVPGLGWGQVWSWAPGGAAGLVAGDGSGSDIFPVDGSAATSGDLGSIGGIAFDALGRLLIACDSANRLAAVNLATGTITTVTGFGAANAATENLIEPLATAVFTDMSSLQTDFAGRPYIGGEQVKRIGA